MAIACFLMLYAPMVVLVLYSFNAGTSIAIWEGFSWRWYEAAWQERTDHRRRRRGPLIVAVSAPRLSRPASPPSPALATTRTRKFRGQTAVFALINQPLMVPEIVTAVAHPDLLCHHQGGDGLHRAGLPDHGPRGVLRPVRLSSDPGAAGRHGSVTMNRPPPTSMPRPGRRSGGSRCR